MSLHLLHHHSHVDQHLESFFKHWCNFRQIYRDILRTVLAHVSRIILRTFFLISRSIISLFFLVGQSNIRMDVLISQSILSCSVWEWVWVFFYNQSRVFKLSATTRVEPFQEDAVQSRKWSFRKLTEVLSNSFLDLLVGVRVWIVIILQLVRAFRYVLTLKHVLSLESSKNPLILPQDRVLDEIGLLNRLKDLSDITNLVKLSLRLFHISWYRR